MKGKNGKLQVIIVKDELANYTRINVSKKTLLAVVSIFSFLFIISFLYSVYALFKFKAIGEERAVLNSKLEDLQEKVSELEEENRELHRQVSLLRKEKKRTIEELAKRIEIINSLMKKVGLKVNSEEGEGGLSVSLSKFLSESDVNLDSSSIINQIDSMIKKFNHVPLGYPTYGRITSPFGIRINPITGRLEFHLGVDIANYWGTPVRAPADGKVVKAGRCYLMGRCIEIDHGNGIKTYYGHLAKVLVKKGDYVKRGEIIGLMGSSGRSTGPHLHYSVKMNGKLVNPKFFLEAVKNVGKEERRGNIRG